MSCQSQDFEALAWLYMNVVGEGAEWLGGSAKDAQDDGGRGGEVSQPFRETWAAGPVAILVPPAVFEKEDTVLDLPVIANCGQQLSGGDRAGIDAGKKIARVRQPHGAIVSDDITVHAERDLAAWEAEGFANVLAVV